MVPKLEKELDCALALTWSTAPTLVKRIEGGDPADALILSQAGIDALAKSGKIVPGSEVTLASSATRALTRSATSRWCKASPASSSKYRRSRGW